MNTRKFHIIRLSQCLCLGFVIAIFFRPVSVRAQDKVEARFTSNDNFNQEFEARPNSAQTTTEDEGSLAGKGYIKIGIVRVEAWTKKTSAEMAQTLRTAALSKAGESGGDVVRLERESVPGSTLIKTGKMKKICTEWESHTVQSLNFHLCSEMGAPNACYHTAAQSVFVSETRYWQGCKHREEVPETKEVKVRVSDGSVWRQDPQLAARVSSRADVKATVYVFRRHSMWGAVRTPAVYCDDVELAYTQNGRYFRVRLEPGRHYFRGEEDEFYARFDLQPGEVAYLASEVGYSPHSSHAHAGVWPESSEVALPTIQGLKALDSGKVVDRTRVAASGELPDNPSLK